MKNRACAGGQASWPWRLSASLPQAPLSRRTSTNRTPTRPPDPRDSRSSSTVSSRTVARRPPYIVFGWRDGTNAKRQLSFKYRFLNPEVSIPVHFTYPMDRILLRTFGAYLYAQYFNGWSESLLSYDQRLPWQLRLGIAVVR